MVHHRTQVGGNNRDSITSCNKPTRMNSFSTQQGTTLSGGSTSNQEAPDKGIIRCFFNALTRKKPLDCRTETNLNRCLNLLDLTALGVGSTLGLGLYVLAGQVASNKAGPAVVISFALAALASAFSALCYAEFAGRVPRAGSAYAYSYITVGEFIAFVIGWNLILEYVIGASSVARGFSGYLCFVYNHVGEHLGYHQNQVTTTTTTTTTTLPPTVVVLSEITSPIMANTNKTTTTAFGLLTTGGNSTATTTTTTTTTTAAANLLLTSSTAALPDGSSGGFIFSILNYLSQYFDWPSIAICFVITIFILFGVKESTNVTLAFTGVNLFVVLCVVISSIGSLDLHNWHLSKQEIPNGYGEGGFIPYGWSGVLAGSATCFFGFIGFDTIASSAEEAQNPKRNVPLSIILSLFISFVAYMAIAIVQTLLWPYYDQNKVTILPFIFEKLDMPITYWVVLLGAIAGLASSQLGGMYPLPRILYSMAHDKLIYSCLANINRRLKLPVRATIVGSIFIAILSCLLDIQDLADMVSIGTLAAYSLVSLSVLILRYEDRSDALIDSPPTRLFHRITTTTSTEQQQLSKPFQLISSNDSDENHQFVLKERGGKVSNTCNHLLTNSSSKQETTSLDLNGGSFQTWPFGKSDLQMNPRASGQQDIQLALTEAKQAVAAAAATNDDSTLSYQSSGSGSNELTTRRTRRGVGGGEKRQNLLDLLITWNQTKEQQQQRIVVGPTNESSRQSKVLISMVVILSIAIDIIAMLLTSSSFSSPPLEGGFFQPDQLPQQSSSSSWFLWSNPKVLLICTVCLLFIMLAVTLLMLSRLPTSNSMPADMFKVPLVPLIPTLSILVNTFLMMNLSYLTWLRFIVWMSFGLFIYFTYGIWNSRGYILYLDIVQETTK